MQNLDKYKKLWYTISTKYERYMKMNKLNTLFLNEYRNLDEICRKKLKADEKGIAKYIETMEKAPETKVKVSVWEDDYHTLCKCMHIYNVIDLHDNKLRKSQCTKQDIAWLKKFAARVEKGADSISKLEKYEEMVAKLKETLKKARPAAQNIAIGCGVAMVVSAVFGKKKK